MGGAAGGAPGGGAAPGGGGTTGGAAGGASDRAEATAAAAAAADSDLERHGGVSCRGRCGRGPTRRRLLHLLHGVERRLARGDASTGAVGGEELTGDGGEVVAFGRSLRGGSDEVLRRQLEHDAIGERARTVAVRGLRSRIATSPNESPSAYSLSLRSPPPGSVCTASALPLLSR